MKEAYSLCILLISLLVALTGCAEATPTPTPTPTLVPTATPSPSPTPTLAPVLVIIVTPTPTVTPTPAPIPTATPTLTPTPARVDMPTVAPTLGLQRYAETCGTAMELMDSDTWGTWEDVAQNARSAYQTMESLTPPEGLEVFHESMLDMLVAWAAVAEEQPPNSIFGETTANDNPNSPALLVSLIRLSGVRDTLASDTRDTLASSGCS